MLKRLSLATLFLAVMVATIGAIGSERQYGLRWINLPFATDSTFTYVTATGGGLTSVKYSNSIRLPDDITVFPAATDSIPYVFAFHLSSPLAAGDTICAYMQTSYDNTNWYPAANWIADQQVLVGAGTDFTLRVFPQTEQNWDPTVAAAGQWAAGQPNTQRVQLVLWGAKYLRLAIKGTEGGITPVTTTDSLTVRLGIPAVYEIHDPQFDPE